MGQTMPSLPSSLLALTVACSAALPAVAARGPREPGPGDPATAGDIQRPIVGTIRWDAWHRPRTAGEPGGAGGPVMAMMESLGPKRYQHRLPFFAEILSDEAVRIGGYTQDTMDQEIAFAARGGLDYWAFLLYEEGTAMSDGLAFYRSSTHKNEVNFCVIASPNTFGGAEAFRERMQRVVTLVSEPTYQLVAGGRPLVYLFNVSDDWLNAWGGEVNTRVLFDAFRAAVRAAGRAEPYLVVMDFSAAHGKKVADAVGATALSSYAVPGAVGEGAPFRDLAQSAEDFWEQCYDTGAEVVPLAMAGWDRRPRVEHPVPWETYQEPGVGIEKYYIMPTPRDLVEHIKDAMQWTVDNRVRCPAQAVIVYAWNEHDEGGFLCPTLKEDGTADATRLDALAAMLQDFPAVPGPAPVNPEVPRDGLLLWLDANATETVAGTRGHVTHWRDKSGHGHDAVATGTSLTYVGYPGERRVIRFGDGQGYFRIPSIQAAGEVTIITVSRRVAGLPTGPYGRILSYYDGQTEQNGAPADWVAPSWCVPIMDDRPFDARMTSTTATRVDGLCLGKSMSKEGDFFRGDICEILVYERALSASDMRDVRRSLRAKWSLGRSWDGEPAGNPFEPQRPPESAPTVDRDTVP